VVRKMTENAGCMVWLLYSNYHEVTSSRVGASVSGMGS
jgi:hypothetical protein